MFKVKSWFPGMLAGLVGQLFSCGETHVCFKLFDIFVANVALCTLSV